jgi:hypothetical protein
VFRASVVRHLNISQVWKGEAPKNDLMDEVNNSWSRLNGGAAIQQQIDSIISGYSLFTPGKSVKGLISLYQSVAKLEDGYWKNQKLKEIQLLIEACSGLWVEGTTSDAYLVQGDSMRVNFFLNNRNGNSVTLKNISIAGLDSSFNRVLESNRNMQFAKALTIPASTPVSQPYWLEHEMKEGYFDVQDQLLIGNADSKPVFEIKFLLNIEGQDFVLTRSVAAKKY